LAELITQSNPGDLFVVKNIGNIVPPSELTEEPNSTGAAIEFAVEVLGVSDIVVCGHSQCGAMAALMDKSCRGDLPRLYQWVELAAPVRDLVQTNYAHLKSDEARLRVAEEENVLFSIERLRSYRCVEKKLAAGAIRLHAWFFKIASGELFAYEPASKQFLPIVR
jgi:carbonic anhydrase